MFTLLFSLAFAQDASLPTTLWIAGEEPVEARRFLDAESTATVEPGEKGDVLFREGGLVRLQIGPRYVWVAETSTTSEAPAGSGAVGLEQLLQLGEGLKLDVE